MAKEFWSGAASRKIIRRVVVECDLVLQSPASFGNGDGGGLTDMPLLVDPYDRRAPLLTGATLAGALRSHLRACERGYRQPIPGRGDRSDDAAMKEERQSATVRLFGSFRADEHGEQSALIVEDARGENVGREVREGVRIRRDSRTAEEDKVFDREVWQAGTQFPLRIELVVRQEDDASALTQALATALGGLVDGSITLGARKQRGYGRVKVDAWRVKSYDLCQPGDLVDWVLHGDEPLGSGARVDDIAAALGGQSSIDAREVFTIDGTFGLDGSLLIRSDTGQDDRGPDTVHLHTRQPNGSKKPILSGTSAGGALRARARKIAATIASRQIERGLLGEAEARELIGELVTGIFGSEEITTGIPPQASRLLVEERAIEGATTNLVQNRVSIDRFTGGSLNTALFNEQPAFGTPDTTVALNVRLVNPRPPEVGLLLLLLKDLWTGDLTLGGESGVGRGRLAGKSAMLVSQRGSAKQFWEILANGAYVTVANGDAAALDAYVATDLRSYFAANPAGVAG